jgi:SAM-dependent methyltransferase
MTETNTTPAPAETNDSGESPNPAAAVAPDAQANPSALDSAPPLDTICQKCGGTVPLGSIKAVEFEDYVATCDQCGHQPDAWASVYDLRTAPAPYYDKEEEDKRNTEIMEWTKEMYFNELVEKYIHERTVSSVQLKELYIAARRGGIVRGQLFLEMFDVLSEELGIPRPKPGERDLGTALDLGCGCSGQLIACRDRAERLVGIDAALTEILLGRRWLFDYALDAGTYLLGANAETMPLADATIDTIFMRDTIEHVADQPLSMQEAWRILKPGGRFFLNSPNRYAGWWPEPHVWMLWVGFLPRKLMPKYTMLRKGDPYRGTRLLGLWELRKFLNTLEPKPAKMILNGVSPPGAELIPQFRWAGGILKRRRFCNLPFVRPFAPEHAILLVKPDE